MNKPKVIGYRCYCMECSDDDQPKDSASQSAAVELERDGIKNSETNPLLTGDSIERALFGA